MLPSWLRSDGQEAGGRPERCKAPTQVGGLHFPGCRPITNQTDLRASDQPQVSSLLTPAVCGGSFPSSMMLTPRRTAWPTSHLQVKLPAAGPAPQGWGPGPCSSCPTPQALPAQQRTTDQLRDTLKDTAGLGGTLGPKGVPGGGLRGAPDVSCQTRPSLPLPCCPHTTLSPSPGWLHGSPFMQLLGPPR